MSLTTSSARTRRPTVADAAFGPFLGGLTN